MKKKGTILTAIIIALSVVIIGLIIALVNISGKHNQTKERTTTTFENTTEEASEQEKEQTKEEAQPQTGMIVDYQCGNTWENGGKQNQQIDVTITNHSQKEYSDWKLTVEVPEDAVVEQGWNGSFLIKNGNLEVVPENYNQTLALDSSVTFGVILSSKEAFTPSIDKTKITANEEAITVVSKDNEESKKDETGVSTTEKEDIEASTAIDNAPKEEGTPVANHGRLKVEGTNLLDASGNPYQLKGVSTHGIAWFPQYVNEAGFRSLRDTYGANVIRLAMYSDPGSGYGEEAIKKVEEGVEYATKLGMYVIIDWHILSDNNPNTHKKEAKAFFQKMSKQYKDNENVLYEICNEPNGDVTWEKDIKPYAKTIIKTIRKNDPNGVIIVGTPTWSQDVDVVAKSPIKKQNNIMYTLHFYAATHKEDLQNKFIAAYEAGLPIFVSEFSICDASGNGALDIESANKWMKLIKEHNISYCAWSLCNKQESSALLDPQCKKTGDFTKKDFSKAGKWLIEQLK